jgi:hypothetical protein
MASDDLDGRVASTLLLNMAYAVLFSCYRVKTKYQRAKFNEQAYRLCRYWRRDCIECDGALCTLQHLDQHPSKTAAVKGWLSEGFALTARVERLWKVQR